MATAILLGFVFVGWAINPDVAHPPPSFYAVIGLFAVYDLARLFKEKA